MKSASVSINETAILKKITDEFAKFRADSSGHSPKRLRELTASALVQGLSRTKVAKAAGVSPKTISNWARSVEPQAKQLNIIDDLTAIVLPVSTLSTPAATICIRLVSGVEIVLPKNEMNRDFLILLSGLGGAQ